MESEADYVLALKGNHKHLAEDVKDAFTGPYKEFAYNTLEKDHGGGRRADLYSPLLSRGVG